MNSDQRLTELKKAYAEIIMNTAKEAAARVMVSQQKAARFEYELKHAKQDAIRMFSNFKHKMDLQVSEAAVASCTQQKKIQELEAQLEEAEDIVKDLRDELRAVEAERERLSQVKEVKHSVHVDNGPTRETVTLPPSEVLPNSYIDQANKRQRIFSSLFPLKKSVIGNGDYLPSIILRSKETELYRNWCTQRVRACELNTPDKNSSFSVQTNDKNKNINPMLSFKQVEVQMVDVAADNSCLTSRDSVIQIHDTPDKHSSFSMQTNDKNKTISPKLSLNADEVQMVDVAADNSCLTSRDSVKQTHDTPDKHSSFSVQTNDKNKNISPKLSFNKDEVQMVDAAADNSCLTSRDSVKQTDDTPVDENLVRMLNSQSTSGNEVTRVGQEKDEVDPSLASAELNVFKTFQVPSRPKTHRVIKYTFQRKRKRGVPIGGNGCSEVSHENRTVPAGSVKGNLIGESTPEKIHVAPVACQISNPLLIDIRAKPRRCSSWF